MKMNNSGNAIKKTQVEICENRRKAIHNQSCTNVDDLQPYDNREFLNMVTAVKSHLASRITS